MLQHGRGRGPQLNIRGDLGDAPEGYDLDLDAIPDDDAAAEADGDGDAFMADARSASSRSSRSTAPSCRRPTASLCARRAGAPRGRVSGARRRRSCCFPFEAPAPAPSFLVEGVGTRRRRFSAVRGAALVPTPRAAASRKLGRLARQVRLAPPPY